jgi:hypothetical protein
MAICSAGKGCAISCPGQCVAYWDHDTGVCHKQCIQDFAEPLDLGAGRIDISIGEVTGRNVARLLGSHIPRDLSEELIGRDKPITLRLMNTTVNDLVTELYQKMGGMLAE